MQEITITKEKIKPEIIELMKKDNGIKLRFAILLEKSIYSINRYINNNDAILTAKHSLQLIAKYFNTDINDLTVSYE